MKEELFVIKNDISFQSQDSEAGTSGSAPAPEEDDEEDEGLC